MPKSVPMSSFIIVFLLGCIAGGILSRNLWGQVSSAPGFAAAPAVSPSDGRYQLLVPSDNAQYVMDTQTGRVWYRYGVGVGAAWEEQGPDFSKGRAVAKP